MPQPLHTELQDAILRVEFVRPERKNALTNAMYTRLVEVLAQASADPAIRVVLVHGAQNMFTAGNDIQEFLETPSADLDSPVMRLLRALARFEKPIVAAVAGPAVGIGTTMLLHCDLVVAAEDAQFALPFVNLGLCPEAASSLLLPALCGMARAAELLMLGEPLSAARALEFGLINRVVPSGEALAQAQAFARSLAAKPPAALRATKATLRAPLRQAVLDTIDREAALFSALLSSPEAKEALAAFMEKRKPDFSRFT